MLLRRSSFHRHLRAGRYGDSLRAGVRLEQNYGLEDGKLRVPADLPLDI
jgi:hypothetical protein